MCGRGWQSLVSLVLLSEPLRYSTSRGQKEKGGLMGIRRSGAVARTLSIPAVPGRALFGLPVGWGKGEVWRHILAGSEDVE